MPIFGEPTFDKAVQKIMKEQNVSKASAQKIVGSAEKKARLLKIRLSGLHEESKHDPPIRRENPRTPLRKEVPFGKETRTLKQKRTDVLNKMGVTNVSDITGKKIRLPKPRRKDFTNIIGAKQQIAELREKQIAIAHKHAIIFKGVPRGHFKAASLVTDNTSSRFAKYWLLNSNTVNGNGWGVSPMSIAKNIKKFVGRPFVVTAQSWVEGSEYGEQFEHPYLPTNDINVVLRHQERFRVGTIREVFEKNGDWFANIEMKTKFAGRVMPPFCSPAIFQNNMFEAEGQISDWEALHLAGLFEDPAYGARVALLRGTCLGTSEQCSIQFKVAKQAQTLCPTGTRIAVITKGNTTFQSLSPESIVDVEDIEQNVKPLPGSKPRKDKPIPRFLKKRIAAIETNRAADKPVKNVLGKQPKTKIFGISKVQDKLEGNLETGSKRIPLTKVDDPQFHNKSGTFLRSFSKENAKKLAAAHKLIPLKKIPIKTAPELFTKRRKSLKMKISAEHGGEGSIQSQSTSIKKKKKRPGTPTVQLARIIKTRISALRSGTNAAVNRVNVLGVRKRKKKLRLAQSPEDMLRKVNSSLNEPNTDSQFLSPKGDFVGGGSSHHDQITTADPLGKSFTRKNLDSDEIVTNFSRRHKLPRVQDFSRGGTKRTTFGIHNVITRDQLKTIKSLEDGGREIGFAVGKDFKTLETGSGFRGLVKSLRKNKFLTGKLKWLK